MCVCWRWGWVRLLLPVLALLGSPEHWRARVPDPLHSCPLGLLFPPPTPLSGTPHGPLTALPGSGGLQLRAFLTGPASPSRHLSTAQESRGDVWIPEGMFSTFLETHCGLVFCGKGLGRGSAQWNGWWLGGARMEETFIERPLCTRPRGFTDA